MEDQYLGRAKKMKQYGFALTRTGLTLNNRTDFVPELLSLIRRKKGRIRYETVHTHDYLEFKVNMICKCCDTVTIGGEEAELNFRSSLISEQIFTVIVM